MSALKQLLVSIIVPHVHTGYESPPKVILNNNVVDSSPHHLQWYYIIWRLITVVDWGF